MPHFDARDVIVDILCFPLWAMFKIHRKARSESKKLKENRIVKARTPVSLHKKERRARLPKFLSTFRRGEMEAIEQQSRLLALPAELRCRIWAYVYSDTIHIARKGRSMRCAVCPGPELVQELERSESYSNADRERPVPLIKDVVQCTCYKTGIEPRMYNRRPQHEIRDERETLLNHKHPMSGLHRVCKQIYSETIDFLYTTPSFALPTQLSLTHFADTIPSRRLSQIQSLHLYVHLDSWTSHSRCGWHGLSTDDAARSEFSQACKDLKSMTGLQEIVIILRWGGGAWRHQGYWDFFAGSQSAFWRLVNELVEALDGRHLAGVLCPVIENRESNGHFMDWAEIEKGSEGIREKVGPKWTVARWNPTEGKSGIRRETVIQVSRPID
ncbi:MAG: hypothetical protein Q9160_002440 [Pyrenula sp. 1 TL-2023]